MQLKFNTFWVTIKVNVCNQSGSYHTSLYTQKMVKFCYNTYKEPILVLFFLKLTLVRRESAKDAGLSVGLNSGAPVAMSRNLPPISSPVVASMIPTRRANVFHLR